MPNDHADWLLQAGAAPVPPDWQANNAVQDSGTASIVAGPVAGIRYLLSEVTFSVKPNAGRVFVGRVWDGATGGNLIGQVLVGNPSAALAPDISEKKLHNLHTTAGNQITIDYDFAAQAGERQMITASGYQVV